MLRRGTAGLSGAAVGRRGQGSRGDEARAAHVRWGGDRELEALGSAGPLYNSKTIESVAPVTYPRARGRRAVAEGIVGRLRKSVTVIEERRDDIARWKRVRKCSNYFSNARCSLESVPPRRGTGAARHWSRTQWRLIELFLYLCIVQRTRLESDTRRNETTEIRN